jgi:hypothetical protein
MPKNITRMLGLLALPIGSLPCACSRNAVDLGDNAAPVSVVGQDTRCGPSGIVPEAVVVKTQADLDALAGCESIAGDLKLQVFRGIDLSPLGSLRSVAGVLDIQDAGAGWLESLHGLEALEQVGGLNIWNTKVQSLEPLSHLQKLDYSPLSGPPGVLSLHGNDNLKDLHGLERAQGLSSIDIASSAALESLSGLIVPESLASVIISNTPALTNIDALAPLSSPYGGVTLALSGTGLRDLSALSSVQGAGDVSISDNPQLTDATALSSLIQVRSFHFSRNALTALPSFAKLNSSVLYFEALDEPELSKLTLDVPNGLDQATPSILDESGFLFGLRPGSTIEIARCGKLQTLDIPSGSSSAYILAIHDDPNLTNITLASLQHLDYLVVDDNPNLTQLTLGSLQTVGSLEITNNPKFSTAGMSSLRTFDRTMNGNADAAPGQ